VYNLDMNNSCSVPTCSKPVDKRGWCGMHYRRWQRHGNPMTNLRPEIVRGTPEERFWAKVEKGKIEECWLWLGSRLPFGYGSFGKGRNKTILAHRMSYVLTHGVIPEGLEISHTCDNPPCVNPRHLVAETHSENLARSSITQSKRNAAKTHCKHGHLFDDSNTIRRPDKPNSRGCRACGRLAAAKYQSKKRDSVYS